MGTSRPVKGGEGHAAQRGFVLYLQRGTMGQFDAVHSKKSMFMRR